MTSSREFFNGVTDVYTAETGSTESSTVTAFLSLDLEWHERESGWKGDVSNGPIRTCLSKDEKAVNTKSITY